MTHFKDLEHSGSRAERDSRGEGKPTVITGLSVTTSCWWHLCGSGPDSRHLKL